MALRLQGWSGRGDWAKRGRGEAHDPRERGVTSNTTSTMRHNVAVWKEEGRLCVCVLSGHDGEMAGEGGAGVFGVECHSYPTPAPLHRTPRLSTRVEPRREARRSRTIRNGSTCCCSCLLREVFCRVGHQTRPFFLRTAKKSRKLRKGKTGSAWSSCSRLGKLKKSRNGVFVHCKTLFARLYSVVEEGEAVIISYRVERVALFITVLNGGGRILYTTLRLSLSRSLSRSLSLSHVLGKPSCESLPFYLSSMRMSCCKGTSDERKEKSKTTFIPTVSPRS